MLPSCIACSLVILKVLPEKWKIKYSRTHQYLAIRDGVPRPGKHIMASPSFGLGRLIASSDNSYAIYFDRTNLQKPRLENYRRLYTQPAAPPPLSGIKEKLARPTADFATLLPCSAISLSSTDRLSPKDLFFLQRPRHC